MEYVKFSRFINSTQYGYTAEKTSNIEGNVKYLRITDIVPYFVNEDSVPLCLIPEDKKEKYLVKENDLLIARTGATTGYNLLVPKQFDNYIFASYLIRFNFDKEKIYPKYLKHVLKSKQWYGFINNYIGGSAQPGMNPRTFGKFEFPYTEITTQINIADILENYDLLIETNNKRIKILEQMAEEVYKEWFIRCRFPEYKNYDFKHENPKGWVLGIHNDMKIPKNWSFGKVETIGCFFRGKNITKEQMVEGTIPVISAGINPSGYHNVSNVKGISLTISASGANAGYLKYNLEDIWAADCSYYQDDSNIWFMYHSLNFIRKAIDNLQVGSAQPHVYPKNINKLCIVIPEEKYIHEFNEQVMPFYLEIKKLREQNQNLEKQRDLLLPKLMSGKLEVK